MLQLRFLGTPEISLAGKPVADALSNKAQAILVYLALTGRPQTRAALAALLWGDVPDVAARSNLRKVLVNLRRLLGDYLEIDRHAVALKPDSDYWVDVAEFEAKALTASRQSDPASALIDPKRLQDAVELYRGDFMSGFYSLHAPDFEAWLLSEQARLRELVIQTLYTLAGHYVGHGALNEAIAYTRRLLALEPWREEAHRQLMWLLARDGQRGAALAQYETCRHVLAEELGVEPGLETTALYQQIRDGDLGRGRKAGEWGTAERGVPGGWAEEKILPPPRPPAPPRNLPSQPTPFIGRVEDLDRIARRLADPACRLLTLVGPGGIGKTRLAIQAASQLVTAADHQSRFRHGVYFVPLASVSSPDLLVSTIADVLRFTFYSGGEPQTQLLDYLREKELLLLLDNFEQLLTPPAEDRPGGEELVTAILAAAPAVKILVTSREALNVQEEWFQLVAGMSFPETSAEAASEGGQEYDAIRLFMQCARRARPGFVFTAEQEAVTRICRLVEGMPLVIELAAAWLRTLPCADIARQLERNLDFLATSMRNVPARHRSVRAVFDHSWSLLTEAEQAALGRLSVFRGGFWPAAAEEVAGASLPLLAALVEKSLVQATSSGRYHLHELLRQFAQEKLETFEISQISQVSDVRERHSTYYAAFAQERETALKGVQQQAALAEMSEEVENIRAGWNWAVETTNTDRLDQMLDSLYEFYRIRSRFRDGEEAFRKAAEEMGRGAGEWRSGGAREKTNFNRKSTIQNRKSQIVFARLLARQGAFCFLLAIYGVARELLQKSLAIVRRLEVWEETAFTFKFLGQIAGDQNEIVEAKQLLEESLAINREMGNLPRVVETLYELSEAIGVDYGDYAAAKQYGQESLALSRTIGNQRLIAYSLERLGGIAFYLGEYLEAQQYFRESIVIFKEIDDPHGLALALGGLGWVAWGLGGEELVRAKPFAEESLALCRQAGDQAQTAYRFEILGQMALALKEYAEAQQYYQEMLPLCQEIGHAAGVSLGLTGLGAAACGLGDLSIARQYLREALQNALIMKVFDMPVVNALVRWAALLVKESYLLDHTSPIRAEKREQTVELLALVLQQPTSWQVFKDSAARLLAELEAELPPEVVAVAQEWGKSRPLAEVVAKILADYKVTLPRSPR